VRSIQVANHNRKDFLRRDVWSEGARPLATTAQFPGSVTTSCQSEMILDVDDVVATPAPPGGASAVVGGIVVASKLGQPAVAGRSLRDPMAYLAWLHGERLAAADVVLLGWSARLRHRAYPALTLLDLLPANASAAAAAAGGLRLPFPFWLAVPLPAASGMTHLLAAAMLEVNVTARAGNDTTTTTVLLREFACA
jgi:hypothetical protein